MTKVKPLRWMCSKVFGFDKWRGISPFGEFHAFTPNHRGEAAIEATKTRVQAQYERQVLECLEDVQPDRIAAMERALKAASHALRSYQYGNSATDLAKATADHCDAVLEGEKP